MDESTAHDWSTNTVQLSELLPFAAALMTAVTRDGEVVDVIIVDANEAADRVMLPVGSLVGCSVHDLPLVDGAVELLGAFSRIIASEQAQTLHEMRVSSPAGGIQSVWDVVLRPMGPQVLGVAVDVTEQWRAKRDQIDAYHGEQMRLERTRLARDLHDTAIQDVLSASLALARLASEADAETSVVLHKVLDLHDDAVRHLRSVIFDLRSSPTKDPERAVGIAVRNAAVALGFMPAVSLGHLDRVKDAPNALEQLLHILREALSNVARHARAANVRVEIWEHDGCVRLAIIDDGVGLPDDADRRSGRWSGIANMHDRAEIMGGRLTVEPNDDGGMRLECEIPLAVGGPAS